MSVSQVADSVPVATLPVSDMVPSVQFADSPAGAGVASFTSVCPSSQQEQVNQETDFENEMKLQKLDDQFIQLLNEVTTQSVFLSDLFKETRLRKGKQTLRAGRPTSSGRVYRPRAARALVWAGPRGGRGRGGAVPAAPFPRPSGPRGLAPSILRLAHPAPGCSERLESVNVRLRPRGGVLDIVSVSLSLLPSDSAWPFRSSPAVP